MQLINTHSPLWSYLSEEVKGLIIDGEILLDHAGEYRDKISDFSYLVFPFSKAYEGFLKKTFLDLGMIREDEYFGDEIRIGRILNPGYINEHNSAYRGLSQRSEGNTDLASYLWQVWKKGRNQVFHYFPHNFRRLSYGEALSIIQEIVAAMEKVVVSCFKK